jgi:hypothetical protein
MRFLPATTECTLLRPKRNTAGHTFRTKNIQFHLENGKTKIKLVRTQFKNDNKETRQTRGATGWATEGLEFESRKRQELSLLHVVQTGSGAHTASYSMGTRGLSRG